MNVPITSAYQQNVSNLARQARLEGLIDETYGDENQIKVEAQGTWNTILHLRGQLLNLKNARISTVTWIPLHNDQETPIHFFADSLKELRDTVESGDPVLGAMNVLARVSLRISL